MKKNKAEEKQGVTLVEVYTQVMGTQEMTMKLMGRIDSMDRNTRARFDIVDGRLNKIETKQIEHDQQFGQVDQQFGQVNQQLGEIKQMLQNIDRSVESHGQRLTALEGNR